MFSYLPVDRNVYGFPQIYSQATISMLLPTFSLERFACFCCCCSRLWKVKVVPKKSSQSGKLTLKNVLPEERERLLQFIWKLLVLTRLSYLHSYRVCSHVVFVSLLPCGQSYKSSTIVNYVTLASCWREICN